jgi:hypothetical protein
MPKLSVAPQVTTSTRVEVKLSPAARRMLIERGEEHKKLRAVVAAAKGTKKKPGRMKRIETEVDTLFTKERQGAALLDGVEVGGHKFKMVLGKRSVFDKKGFMKKYGLGQADFDAFTTQEDNAPYIKITAEGDEDED